MSGELVARACASDAVVMAGHHAVPLCHRQGPWGQRRRRSAPIVRATGRKKFLIRPLLYLPEMEDAKEDAYDVAAEDTRQ